MENKLDLHLECKIEFKKSWQSFKSVAPKGMYGIQVNKGKEGVFFFSFLATAISYIDYGIIF